jgi:hypothetical protein
VYTLLLYTPITTCHFNNLIFLFYDFFYYEIIVPILEKWVINFRERKFDMNALRVALTLISRMVT